jgi:hypothetical protein
MDRYYLRANSSEECWELLERDAISDDGKKEDALLAKFYDGNETGSPLANIISHFLNKGEPEG